MDMNTDIVYARHLKVGDRLATAIEPRLIIDLLHHEGYVQMTCTRFGIARRFIYHGDDLVTILERVTPDAEKEAHRALLTRHGVTTTEVL